MSNTIEFKHTFLVSGKKLKVTVKCVTQDCYPGGRVTNYPEITEELRRATTSEENVVICQEMLKASHDFALSLREGVSA